MRESSLALAAEAADVLDRTSAREEVAAVIEVLHDAGEEGIDPAAFLEPTRKVIVWLLVLAGIVEPDPLRRRLTARARQRLDFNAPAATGAAVH